MRLTALTTLLGIINKRYAESTMKPFLSLVLQLQKSNVTLLAAGVAFALAVSPCAVLAGQFSVSPVRIYMATKDRTIAVTVTNESSAELVMQADLFLWRQTATGLEELTPTEDLIAAPPILKLAPGAKQVVRLAMLKPMPITEQLTYRLMVREIPEVKPPEPGIQLQIALAFSLPVFITPPGAKRQLACGLQRTAPDAVRATCENTGNAYAQPTEFKLSDANGQTLLTNNSGGYILPGIKRRFELKRTDGAIAGGKMQLLVTQDDLSVQTFDALLAD
jgi:fimbrial chaperone protein